jgi:hypothetical protein
MMFHLLYCFIYFLVGFTVITDKILWGLLDLKFPVFRYLFLMPIKDSFTGYMLVYNLRKALALAMEFFEGLVTF